MIRYGTNPIAWSNDDDRALGGDISLAKCLTDASQIGFDGIEQGHKFPAVPGELKEFLAPHGLAFISGWHSLHLLTRPLEAELTRIQPHLDLLKAMGCTICIGCEVSQAIHGRDDIPLADSPVLPGDRWVEFGANVEAMAEHCAAQGLMLVYHHHGGTMVETADEIDALMAHTGPATHLLLDTGHALLAGVDPAALAGKYTGRIGHIHCKNIRSTILAQVRGQKLSFLEGVRRGLFTVPGDTDGAVDFSAVLKVMAAGGYDGWLVVEAEQDPAIRIPFEYQSLGLHSLKALARAAGLDKRDN